MTNKLGTFIKLVSYYFVDVLVRSNKKIVPDSILLIRLDAIGDYILFRNFIEILKNSKKYRGCKITFVGNIAWRELAEKLDSEFIEHFIWIDRTRFIRNPLYRYHKLREIASNGYEAAINSTYSRDFFYTDAIIKAVNANEKIGSVGDLSNIKKWQKNICDRYYTNLLPAKDEILFEFYRNREFFEYLLDARIDITKPSLGLSWGLASINLPENYTVIFIGASNVHRKWASENFAKVGRYVCEEYNTSILICGLESDRKNAEKIKAMMSGCDVYDLTGKTTLLGLSYIISRAKLLVSNETAAPHIATAIGLPVVVIYNGNHFGRFTPYPNEISGHYLSAYHPEIEKDLNGYKKISNSCGYSSELNINEIKVEKVIKKVNEVLKY